MNEAIRRLRAEARQLVHGKVPKAMPVLRPVTVRPDPAPGAGPGTGPVLLTPQGVRVEGLDRDTLIAVLRIPDLLT